MSRMIIDNQSQVDDYTAFCAVRSVLAKGKLSNNGRQHCYASGFDIGGKENAIMVYTTINKGSERFLVLDQ